MSEFNSKSTQNQHGNFELEPCPFCGKQPFTRVRTVRCDSITSTLEFSVKCECDIEKRLKLELCDTDFSKVISSINAVIADWNTRTPKERGGEN